MRECGRDTAPLRLTVYGKRMLTDPTDPLCPTRDKPQSESNAAIFFNMIAELKKQTDAVEPTAFHSWLKQLDDDGKLFRVYTQSVFPFPLSPLRTTPTDPTSVYVETLTPSRRKRG